MITYLFAQTEGMVQAAEEVNVVWGWSEMLWTSLIGFTLVVMMLIALVYIMRIFGFCFSISRSAGITVDDEAAPQPMISDEEIVAIATAMKIYKGALHDKESEVLTILNIKRAYSPWNSKIHGLTQLPDRK